MPSQKRKINEANDVNEHVCKCFKAHKTKDKCEDHALLENRAGAVDWHRGITAQVILYSKTVEVLVGMERMETFVVHRDLLALHSTYFSDQLKNKEPGEDSKITVVAKPALFVDFVSWIYSGEFLKTKNPLQVGQPIVDELWALGHLFQAPAFQNYCMDDCRTYCKDSEIDPGTFPWPFTEGIELMYSVTPKGSRLRKLALDSLTYRNPLQLNQKGSEAWGKWKGLLTGQNSEHDWMNDLREDFALEVGTDWENIAPWDDRRRDDYMEKETPLDDRWDAQILAARTKTDIKRSALTKKDLRSAIEWAHLQRGKKR